MKTTVLLIGLVFSNLFSTTSFAMFSDDELGAIVTCAPNNSTNFRVSITADRRKIVLSNDQLKKIFNVVNFAKPASDGDTYITYVGLLGYGATATKVKMTFNDRGNTFDLNGKTIAIDNCSSR